MQSASLNILCKSIATFASFIAFIAFIAFITFAVAFVVGGVTAAVAAPAEKFAGLAASSSRRPNRHCSSQNRLPRSMPIIIPVR